MTQPPPVDTAIFDELQLTLKVRSGEYCVVRLGATLVLYYARPMRELPSAVDKLIGEYLSFIPEGSVRSMLSTAGVWREFARDALKNRIRRLSAAGLEYSSIHLSSGVAANVGDYGFHFFGSNFLQADIKPRETCACVFEFPASVIGRENDRFIEWTARVAEIEPFESGHAGYAFKHLSETWRDQALTWIGQRAVRFMGLDISYDTFRNGARARVVNVSWLTFLGTPIIAALGGELAVKAKLSDYIEVRNLKTGLMVIAGDHAPIGDVNRGATDIGPLREVAAMTKPVRAEVPIGFGGDAFRQGWLNRFD